VGYFLADLGFKLNKPYVHLIYFLEGTGNIQLTLLVYVGIQAIIGLIAFLTINLCLIVLVLIFFILVFFYIFSYYFNKFWTCFHWSIFRN
jgi:hypothetical protein